MEQLLNLYYCSEDGTLWADVYDCEVDTECPTCKTDTSPYDSQPVEHTHASLKKRRTR